MYVAEPPSRVPKEMKLVTIDMTLEDTEANEGTGYKAFNIPADITTKYVIKSPVIYRDRGIYRTND